ncbi:flagellar biosynthetic protein FliR, partial [Pseudomonas aeruginosa]
MLELTHAQIGGWIASLVRPLLRVAAVRLTMPVTRPNPVP